MSGLLLAPDTWLTLDGVPHRIVEVDLETQQVALCGPDGTVDAVDLDWLLQHPGMDALSPVPDRRPAGEEDEPGVAARLAGLTQAPERALTKAQRQLAHVLEVETGYQSGDPDDGTTPDPRYDPRRVPLVTERRRAKAAELAAPTVDPDLRMSYRTLQRRAVALGASAYDRVLDGRASRAASGTRLKHELLDAIEHVVERRRTESNFQTLSGLVFQVRAHVQKVHPKDADELLAVSDKSIVRAVQSMYTPAELLKGKAKYRVTKLPKTGQVQPRLRCTRPGEIVMGDAKDLDVLLQNTRFEGAVRGRLLWWVDVYSCSVVETRVVVGSEKAVDIAQSIRGIGLPKLMEEGWEDDLRWPFVGVPAHIVDEIAGGPVAGVPFVNAENLVVDNGRTYRAFANVAAAKTLGVNMLPARRIDPTDKARVERAFRTLDTLLCQHLQGYRGPDTSERGVDPERAARYTPRQIEAIIRHWVASIWQRRPLDPDTRPSWCEDVSFSANALYNFGIQQSGLPLRSLTPQEYAALLPGDSYKLHRGGFKVRKHYYDWEPVLDDDGARWPDPLGPWRNPDRREVETWGAKHTVKLDDRDRRWVWWQHPETGRFVRLTWRGMWGVPDFPAFNDKDADALAEVMAERRLDPLDGPALGQALLRLLQHHDPDWDVAGPGAAKGPAAKAEGKRQRTAAARREQQAASAARDAGTQRSTGTPAAPAADAAVTPQEQHSEALANVQRQAREAALAGRDDEPRPPVPLGRSLGNLFDLPADDADDSTDAGHGGTSRPALRLTGGQG